VRAPDSFPASHTGIADKGFRFITPNSGDPDVFCHFRHLADDRQDYLDIGTRVSFQIGTAERRGKPEACNVKVI
jgi:cold shock CspA family protein